MFSHGKCVGSVVLIAYVDDILVCSSSREAEEAVVQAIAKVVPTKTTGQVLPGKQGGGSLRFIGRIIERQPGDDVIFHLGDETLSVRLTLIMKSSFHVDHHLRHPFGVTNLVRLARSHVPS